MDIISETFDERRKTILKEIESDIIEFYNSSAYIRFIDRFKIDLESHLSMLYPNYLAVVGEIDSDRFSVDITIGDKKYTCKFDISNQSNGNEQ